MVHHRPSERCDGPPDHVVCYWASWFDGVIEISNRDGSPIFKSSKVSMWPIQIIINELPPKLRWANVIVTGLWFGKKKPNMRLFMDTFVKDMTELSKEPIEWTSANDGVGHPSHVYVACACLDSPARALVQNTTQFNGYYGCSWCLHPGTAGDGNSQIKYTAMKGIKDRTTSEMKRDMMTALQEQVPVNGVKGPSPMINLPGFHIVWSFSPDYMHSVLLGVARQLTEMWLTTVDRNFYIGSPSNMSKINARLQKIQIPVTFKRYPRSLEERKFWKATEWKFWLLYYSIPCLLGTLPEEYLRHWGLLVQAVYTSLKDRITFSEVNDLDVLFTEFVIKLELLYGKSVMTSNVHQLLHHAKSVKYLGPAWSRSAFVFEGQNGFLLNLITAAKGAPMQVLNRYIFQNKLKFLIRSQLINIRDTARNLVDNSNPHIKNCTEIVFDQVHVYMLNKVHTAKLSVAEHAAMDANGYFDNVQVFQMMIVGNPETNSVYHSELYNNIFKVEKSNSTFVRSTGGKYYILKKCITYIDSANNVKCGAVAQEIIVYENSELYLPTHIRQCEFAPDHECYKYLSFSEIFRLCIVINLGRAKYVRDIANLCECD